MARRRTIAEDVPAYEAADTTLTAGQILAFLRKKHGRDELDKWIYVEELTTATGTADATRIDAWAMHTWPSAKHERIAYEVKISRADYFREVRQPAKRRYAMMFSNLFYFVTPRGLVSAEEVPSGCGLIEYGRDGRPYTRVAAPWRDSNFPTWGFVAALMRRLRAEANIRVADSFTYEHEMLDARKRVFAQERQYQQERADGITKRAQTFENIVYQARQEIESQREALGLPPIPWMKILKESQDE